jgi:excinuclease ABC subunit C
MECWTCPKLWPRLRLAFPRSGEASRFKPRQMHADVTAHARRLPHAPGCYIFRDGAGKTLYVGKAGDLRKRVASYLRPGGDGRIGVSFLEREARELDFVVTRTEQEAILLENTLIKKLKPRYNIKLRDDKAFLMLRLDRSEDWPWFRFVRRRRADGAEYFGPFGSASSARRTLKLLHKLVPLRDCRDGVFDHRVRPCLKHQIGRCPAPCVGLIERLDYDRLLDRAARILRGDNGEVVRELEARMQEAALELRFEEAQAIKENLAALQRITERQGVVGRDLFDRDVIGCWGQGGEVHVALLRYRDAGLEGSQVHHFRTELPLAELLSSFLMRLYEGDRYVPSQILLPLEPLDLDGLAGWLHEKRDGRCELKVPVKGDKRKAVEMASRNAKLAAEAWRRGDDDVETELGELQRLLNLPELPRRIHCLDVSTIQGRHTVASRVAAKDGQAHRPEYRRFEIRGEAGKDDFASMRQAVERSLRLCLDREDEELPDLLLVDGGKGQLSSALEALAACGLGDELPVVGIAKDRERGDEETYHTGERIFLPGRRLPVPLEPGTASFRILTNVRDEAHRFAIGYHRKLRQRIGSELDEVPGLGPTRRRALLRHFGSLDGVKAASLDELRAVKGLPLAVAEAVFAKYRGEGE